MAAIFSVKTFSERNKDFPQGGMRHYIFNADSNGLAKSGALIRLGRKILIDEGKFFDWVRSGAAK